MKPLKENEKEERYIQWKSLLPSLYDWVAAAEHISQFNEEACYPFVRKFKTMLNPGKVNRIKELSQNSKIVAIHTNSPKVLIWNIETEPTHHAVLEAPTSHTDLVLTDHKDNAEFDLAMCSIEPFVLFEGKDKCFFAMGNKLEKQKQEVDNMTLLKIVPPIDQTYAKWLAKDVARIHGYTPQYTRAVEPPDHYVEYMKLNGLLDVDLNDPDLAHLFK
ncbi:hypothetical protein VNO77_04052 [Canavalia gladiata]|uniref:Uncharacterized protein n=1 Tax=Canavalia gladiata TaxID=3824 RepID=A0AAN9R7E9_CANGL